MDLLGGYELEEKIRAELGEEGEGIVLSKGENKNTREPP
jgi:hypothetical protein